MKLCLSVAPKSMNEAITLLRRCIHKVELVEIRVDAMDVVDFRKLLTRPRPNVIITNRRTREGGKFSGTGREQVKTLAAAIKQGAEYVDVELSWGKNVVRQLCALPSRTRIIVSYHNLRKTPRDVVSLYQRARSSGADIVKIATMANSITDNRVAFDLCQRAVRDRQPLIALCMGEYGEPSRILSAHFGSYLTYGPMTASSATAAGQRTYEELKNVFRVQTLSARTSLFGLIGDPVRQSRGIYHHNDFFRRRHVNAVYVNLLVDDLDGFFRCFSRLFAGYSVTMPFKQKVIAYVDRLEGDARPLGIVNTVIRRNGRLVGHNTDLRAIISILKKRISLRSKHVVILGTGATARTMAYASMRGGAKTTVIGRQENKAKKMAAEMNISWTSAEALCDIRCDVLLNATPAGMGYRTDPSIAFSLPRRFLKAGMTVLDAVYEPEMTPLLRKAKNSGCRVISGLELFRRQAELQSRLFLEALA